MSDHQSNMDIRGFDWRYLPKKINVFLIMMKYDDLYFANRYNFFTGSVEWYFLPKTEIKVFLKKMDIRGFGWRPSIYISMVTNQNRLSPF